MIRLCVRHSAAFGRTNPVRTGLRDRLRPAKDFHFKIGAMSDTEKNPRPGGRGQKRQYAQGAGREGMTGKLQEDRC